MKQLVFIPALLWIAGCASIVQGTSQTLIFNLEPKQANCTASRGDDGEIGTITSGNNTLSVSKSKNDIIVKCDARGYESKILRLVSSTQAAGVIGGILLDAGIVDMMTGAMWKYEGTINIVLEREGETYNRKIKQPIERKRV